MRIKQLMGQMRLWAARQARDFALGSWTIDSVMLFAIVLVLIVALILLILPFSPMLMWLDSRPSDRAIVESATARGLDDMDR